jgi:hypothetical protein
MKRNPMMMIYSMDYLKGEPWEFNVRYHRKKHKTRLGAEKEFLAFADAIAAEAKRIRKEMHK